MFKTKKINSNQPTTLRGVDFFRGPKQDLDSAIRITSSEVVEKTGLFPALLAMVDGHVGSATYRAISQLAEKAIQEGANTVVIDSVDTRYVGSAADQIPLSVSVGATLYRC